jgi:hypothetical protein
MLPFGGAECRALREQEFRPQGEFAFLCAFIHLCLFVRASCACVSARMPLRLRVRNQDAYARR